MPLFPLLGVVMQKKGVYPRGPSGGPHCSKGGLPPGVRPHRGTHLLETGEA